MGGEMSRQLLHQAELSREEQSCVQWWVLGDRGSQKQRSWEVDG